MGRDVDIADRNPLTVGPHLHLMIVLQVDIQFRAGGAGNHGVVVGFGHARDIQLRVGAVLIHPRINVDVVTAIQFAVDLNQVVAFDIVVRVGPGHAFQTAGGGIRLHIHIDDVAGS